MIRPTDQNWRHSALCGAVICLALAVLAGCRHPLKVCTDNKIRIVDPVETKVTTDSPPQRNASPLERMCVANGPVTCNRPIIALIDVDGLLANTNMTGPYSSGENPVALFREKLDVAAADPNVCAVVVRINTPGGGVTASDMMCHELELFRQETGLPVIAYLMDIAAGGGYYLATAADLIYAHPTTVTGGIGVILNLYSLQDTMAQFNVVARPIKSGPHVDMGTSTRELTAESRAWLQSMASQFHERFKQVVLHTRPHVNAGDPTNFDGRVFTASQAKSRGLIDGIGYLDDAVAAAQARAGYGDPAVVMFRRNSDPARSPYAITPNTPLQTNWLPLSIPGLERAQLPMFLYLWEIEPTLDR